MRTFAFFTLFSLLALTACKPKPMATSSSNEPPIDFSATIERAKTENKPVLMEFTGSDWCPPCIQMHENIFSKPEFETYAKENLVFVVLDYPNEKPQSEEVKKTNEELAQKFKVEAFPTFVLLNSDGTEIWREVGAFATSSAAFISAIEKAKQVQQKVSTN